MTRAQPLRFEDLEGIKEEIVHLQMELSVASSRSADELVRSRCGRAELVLRVAIFLLEQDPENPAAQDPAGYIAEKINNAFGFNLLGS